MAFNPEQYKEMSQQIETVRKEIGKFIVGQTEAIDFTIYSILANGTLIANAAIITIPICVPY